MQSVGTMCLPLANTAGARGHKDNWRLFPFHSDPGKETTPSPREARALGSELAQRADMIRARQYKLKSFGVHRKGECFLNTGRPDTQKLWDGQAK